MSLYRKGEHERAVDAFSEALRLEPSNERVYNNLALALCKLGRYQEGLEAFKKGGDEAVAYNNLGCVYMAEGKHKEAIEVFEKAIEIKPGFYVSAHENLKRAKASAP